jgi:fatty acid desaturase
MTNPVQAGAMCIPNIGERGRQRRQRSAIVWMVVALVAAVVLLRHAPAGWYLLLFVPFTLAALGWFQARERT